MGATVKSINIQNGVVDLEINDTENIQQLAPTFMLSNGADLFNLGSELQLSGSQILDFSSDVSYQVRSEDRSTLKDWTIRVVQTPLQTAKFFRKNAVCHLDGQIMVEFSVEATRVTLSADNFDSRIQPIFEGKTLFENVPVGVYTVIVGDFTKEITIEQN